MEMPRNVREPPKTGWSPFPCGTMCPLDHFCDVLYRDSGRSNAVKEKDSGIALRLPHDFGSSFFLYNRKNGGLPRWCVAYSFSVHAVRGRVCDAADGHALRYSIGNNVLEIGTSAGLTAGGHRIRHIGGYLGKHQRPGGLSGLLFCTIMAAVGGIWVRLFTPIR